MSLWKGGARKRRDANEREIIDALKAVGAKVWQISGRGLPDLLVCYRGRFFVGEVKTATGTLRPTQSDEFPVWRTTEGAVRGIGAYWP